MLRVAGLVALAAVATAQSRDDCLTCLGRQLSCWHAGWADPCYTGGWPGSPSGCTGSGGVWCPDLVGPTPPPPPPTPAPPLPPTTTAGDDNRMVAFLGNWQACPSDEVTNEYSHLLVSFAVTYVWSPGKNKCDTTCTIKAPLVCNNAKQPALINKWRAAGKKVLLSFGGAGMGGSWDGVNRCWEHCFGKEDSVVSQLRNLVQADNYDGVDIDYEFYHDRSYARKTEAQHFLRTVTQKLKQQLPAGRNIVTHTPMDADLAVGRGYYEVVKEVGAASIDFLMPQYYNGITRPNRDGFASARSHYNNLVSNVYNGDATRMVFGFCIGDCSGTGSNANAQQAVAVMQTLQAEHPCHGGAFFWVVKDDLKGAWSRTVQNVYRHKRGCKGGSTPATPTPPVATPTPLVATPTPPVATPTPPVATPTPPAATPTPSRATPTPSRATPTPSRATPTPPVATPTPPTPPTGGCTRVVGAWGNCHRSGSCCVSGYSCVRQSRWYSQCKPGGNTPPATPTPPASTPTPPAATPTPPAATPTPPRATPTPPVATPTPPTPPTGGIRVWGSCSNNYNGCAGSLICCGNQWYAQCVPGPRCYNGVKKSD